MAAFLNPDAVLPVPSTRLVIGNSKLRDWWPSQDTQKHRDSAAVSAEYRPAVSISDVADALQTFPRASAVSPPPQVFLHASAKPNLLELTRTSGKTRGASSKLQGNQRLSKAPKVASQERQTWAMEVSSFTAKNSSLHRIQQRTIDKDALTRREIHIHLERKRRKGMTLLYSTLHSLLPETKRKTDRCTVLIDAIKHIQTLQKKLEGLAKKKAEILASVSGNSEGNTPVGNFGRSIKARDNPSPLEDSLTKNSMAYTEKGRISSTAADVTVEFCGKDALIALTSLRKKGIWPATLKLLEEQNLEILNVTLSTSKETDFHVIHAKVPDASRLQSFDLQTMIQGLTDEQLGKVVDD